MNTLLEYKKALECTTDSSMIKRWAILKSIADTYTKEKDYENAIIYYTQYLNSKQEHSYEEIEGLANIYSRYSDMNNSKKDELIGKAIDLYQRLAKNYPKNEVYTTYMIAGLNHKLDPKMEKGLAKPDYQKVISLLRNKQYRNNGEDIMLKTAYHYMMYSSYMSNNKSGAKEYARRILEIDPDYEPALEIINLK